MVERMTGSSVAIRHVAKSHPDNRLASTLACLPRNGLGCFGAFLAVVAFSAAGFLTGDFFAGDFFAADFFAAAGVFAADFFAAGFLTAGFLTAGFVTAGFFAAGLSGAAASVGELVDCALLVAEVAFLAPSGTTPDPLSPLVLRLFLAAGRFGLG
jgi:hypothetical protein